MIKMKKIADASEQVVYDVHEELYDEDDKCEKDDEDTG